MAVPKRRMSRSNTRSRRAQPGHRHHPGADALLSKQPLRLDGHVGALVPRTLVRFAGRTVAAWGQPFGIGTFGIEIVIP